MKSWMIWLTILAMAVGTFGLLACGGDDDDDDNDAADDDDDADDDVDDDADDDADDDTWDEDDDADDDADDDTDDDDDTIAFDWDTVAALPPGVMVYAGNVSGHDIVAASGIVNIESLTNADAVEWDMIDGVPAGNYSFDIADGDPLGDSNNYIVVIFGLNSIAQTWEEAYVTIAGDAVIESTGVAGDTFKATATNLEFRPVDLDTTDGTIDWDGKPGYIDSWSIDKTISALPVD